MHKFIYVELDQNGKPTQFFTFATKKELKEKYNRRAAIFGTAHTYYGYHIQRQLILVF